MSSITAVGPVRPVRAVRHDRAEARPRPRAARRPVRLTRRGRAVVVIALAVALVALLSAGRVAVSAASSSGAGRPALATVVVEPGQTLWQIAHRVAPHDDPRDTVIRLERLNGLHGAVVLAGQELLVPAAG